jgi:sugar lactone lactonase YvrE
MRRSVLILAALGLLIRKRVCLSDRGWAMERRVRRAKSCLVAVLAVLSLTNNVGPAFGEFLDVTSLFGKQLLQVDTSTNTTTVLTNTQGNPDSLIFDGQGNIVYTQVLQGQVVVFNPGTHTNTVIASGFPQPRDLALEPGGHSVLLTDFFANKIFRIDLNSHATTVVAGGAGVANPDGITYDNAGHLFAVVNRGSANQSVVQIDPTSGAILNSRNISNITINGDGITFDQFTQNLWVAYNFGNGGGVIELPTSLASATAFPSFGSTLGDGVEADGNGHLFIANVAQSNIAEYDIASGSYTQLTSVFSIDDLAPLSGLGAKPTPEPASVMLLGLGALGLVGYCWLRTRLPLKPA